MSGPLCVVVEMRACAPNGQAAVPPGPAPALSSGPIAAMVPLHTVRGLSTVSHLPVDETQGRESEILIHITEFLNVSTVKLYP